MRAFEDAINQNSIKPISSFEIGLYAHCIYKITYSNFIGTNNKQINVEIISRAIKKIID